MNISDLIWEAGLRNGLRAETIKTYIYAVSKFFRTCHLEPHQVTKESIEKYIIRLIKLNRSGSTINVHLHALRFFSAQVLGKKVMLKIPLLKTPRRLPEYLTQEEIIRFFSAIKNSKQKLIVMLTYGSGFRVSEGISLRVKDLNFASGYGWIRNAKGGKDRMFIIPEMLRVELQEWILENKLQEENWLFPGYGNNHYSDSSVRSIIEQARRTAGILKHINPHSLRHSFATHLLENGYSLIEVNRLLGHSRMETTMVYAHLAQPKLARVRSPLDTLPAPNF